MKHLSLFWYTTLQTLLWLKGRYIEALKFVLVYHVTHLLCYKPLQTLPRYKPYYASRGGTLKHLSLFWYTTLQTLLWIKGRYIEALNCGIPRYKPYYGYTTYTTLQTLLWLKGRYIEALKFVLVYHVTNLIMAQGEVH